MASEKRYNTIDSMPEWAQGTIRALCRKGLIEGNGSKVDANGFPAQLDLSHDMLRLLVINNRAGVYDKG